MDKNTEKTLHEKPSKGQHFAAPASETSNIHAASGAHKVKSSAKRRRLKNVIAALLAAVGVALLAAGAWIWWDAQSQYNAQAENNEKLAGYAKVTDDGSAPPQVDWAGLKAINKDVCAWIQIPGTTVNYPVYKGATNDTYLRTNAYGNYSIGGQIFLDEENKSADLTDEQTLVYGHHLNDGSMFAPVAKMDDQSYFDSIKRVWWVTPALQADGSYSQNNYLMRPLYCYHVSEDDTTVRKVEWKTPEDFHAFLTEKLGIAVTKASDAEATIPSVEHILSLATCNYADGRGRTIVVCVPQQQAS